MFSGEALDLCQSSLGRQGIKRFTALEEGLFIAKIADVRTAARNYQRIGDKVQVALDQVAARERQINQRADFGAIHLLRMFFPEITQKHRPSIFSGADE